MRCEHGPVGGEGGGNCTRDGIRQPCLVWVPTSLSPADGVNSHVEVKLSFQETVLGGIQTFYLNFPSLFWRHLRVPILFIYLCLYLFNFYSYSAFKNRCFQKAACRCLSVYSSTQRQNSMIWHEEETLRRTRLKKRIFWVTPRIFKLFWRSINLLHLCRSTVLTALLYGFDTLTVITNIYLLS